MRRRFVVGTVVVGAWTVIEPAMRGTRFAAPVLVASDTTPLPVRDVLAAGGGQTVGPRDDGVVLCLFRDVTAAGAAVLLVQRRFPAAACVLAAVLGDPGDAHAVRRSCDALLSASAPGRTVLSAASAAAMSDALPSEAWLRDLGSRALPGRAGAERVFELLHEDAVGSPLHGLPAHTCPRS